MCTVVSSLHKPLSKAESFSCVLQLVLAYPGGLGVGGAGRVKKIKRIVVC